MRFLKWLFWTVVYLFRPKQMKFSDFMLKFDRTWPYWRKFKPYTLHTEKKEQMPKKPEKPRLTFASLVRQVCAREKGKKQLNAAQASTAVAHALDVLSEYSALDVLKLLESRKK